MAILEVCVSSVCSAIVAAEARADRVELCENLDVGGLTPSAEKVSLACRALEIPVHVLIRPRAGDFVYSNDEFDVMRHDVAIAKTCGAGGVVLGILLENGSIDRERTGKLIALARPMSVTFHKAFDATPDPFEAIAALSVLSIDRVLTSGQAPTARAGLSCLDQLTRRGQGRMTIMAGGKIMMSDLNALFRAGIREVHVGSGVLTGGEVDPEKVGAFKEAMIQSIRNRDDVR